MRGTTKWFAESYAHEGTSFTSRRADNYEHISKSLQIDTPGKIFLRNGERRENRREILRLRLAPSLREGRKNARVSAQDDRLVWARFVSIEGDPTTMGGVVVATNVKDVTSCGGRIEFNYDSRPEAISCGRIRACPRRSLVGRRSR